MDINELREQIDSIDSQLTALFEERMKASEDVALYKKEHALPIFDSSREEEVIKRNSEYINDSIIKEVKNKELGKSLVSKIYGLTPNENSPTYLAPSSVSKMSLIFS